MPAPNLPAPNLHSLLQKALFKANKNLQPPRLTFNFKQPSHLSVNHMKFTSPNSRQCHKTVIEKVLRQNALKSYYPLQYWHGWTWVFLLLQSALSHYDINSSFLHSSDAPNAPKSTFSYMKANLKQRLILHYNLCRRTLLQARYCLLNN